MKAKINGFISLALIIFSGLFLFSTGVVSAADSKCCIITHNDNSKVCSLLTDSYTAASCLADSFTSGNKNSVDVTCDDSDVCRSFWSESKQAKSIEAAENAIKDLSNWTCVLTYEGEAPKLNRGVSVTEITKNKICVDYKNLASTMAVDVNSAKQLCNQNCDAGATQSANRAKGCLFIYTQTCSQYASNPEASGSGYKGPEFSDLYKELGSTSRNLNKLNLSSPSALIGRLIRVAVGIIGTIALIIFIYAGLVWMTSRGDSGKAESSRSMLLWASLGVVVVLSSYAIVDFIFGTVFK